MHSQWICVLFGAVMALCDAGAVVNLTSSVGSSITFPGKLHPRVYFSFQGKTIASFLNNSFEIEEDIYRNRIHRNSSTGRFTLSGLQKNDSGVYVINYIKGSDPTMSFGLQVFEAVAAPVVSCVNVSADSFTLQCSVTHTEQTTLSWFRGEHPVVSSSSAVLPLTVQLRDYTSHYQCVAQNPAENKTVEVDVTAVCERNETESTGSANYWEFWVMVIRLAVYGLGLAVFFAVLHVRSERKRKSTEQRELNLHI